MPAQRQPDLPGPDDDLKAPPGPAWRNALAKALDVPQIRIGGIVNGRRAITPDTTLRLARHFATSPEFWLGMQATYDLETARDRVGAEIEAGMRSRAA